MAAVTKIVFSTSILVASEQSPDPNLLGFVKLLFFYNAQRLLMALQLQSPQVCISLLLEHSILYIPFNWSNFLR